MRAPLDAEAERPRWRGVVLVGGLDRGVVGLAPEQPRDVDAEPRRESGVMGGGDLLAGLPAAHAVAVDPDRRAESVRREALRAAQAPQAVRALAREAPGGGRPAARLGRG